MVEADATRNNDGIGEVVAVQDDAAARPATDEFALRCSRGDFVETSEISKRERGLSPAVESQNGCVASWSSASSIAMFIAAECVALS